MTAVFAGSIVASLLALASVAVYVDSRDRNDTIANETAQQVLLVAKGLYFQNNRLMEPGLQQQAPLPDSESFGIVVDHKIVFAAPSQNMLPTDAGLERIVDHVTADTVVLRSVSPAQNQVTYRWAATPILNEGHVGAVLIVGGPTPGRSQHDLLVVFLLLTVAGLTAVAACAGHILSGIAVRGQLVNLERQEQFLVEASHELRTPLARLALILDVEGHDSTESESEVIARAASQVVSLTDLVSGLMTRARVQGGRDVLQFRRLRLDQLIRAQTHLYAIDRIRFVSVGAPVVIGNPELLAQAARNLIENALTYGRSDVVDVSVSARSFSVTDHGPGIPSDSRSDVRGIGVGDANGTGMGLALVDWAAAMHRGHLILRDTPGGGLTADFILGDLTKVAA